jgi:hypothetical protein
MHCDGVGNIHAGLIFPSVSSRFPNKLTEYARWRHRTVGDASRRASYRAVPAILTAVVGVAIVACDRTPDHASTGTSALAAAPVTSADSAARYRADSAAAMAAVRDTARQRRLSPAAESIAPYLVFAPADEPRFVAAVRNARWLLDIGRMDVDVRKDTARLAAFREAAAVLSPVAPRAVFRLHWAQGAEDVVVDSFAVYNGRIVVRVYGSEALDSAAHGKGSWAAHAVRADSAAAPVATSCELRATPDSAAQSALAALTPAERRAQASARKAADSVFSARVAVVRDSLESVVRLERPPYERLQRRLKLSTSQARGCFGGARRALVVSWRAGDAEWVREQVVLVAPDGAVTALRVEDGRFRAHDLLAAFDADGDGVDDLATRGTTHRAGGTSILRLDLANRRLVRLSAGFAWEVF